MKNNYYQALDLSHFRLDLRHLEYTKTQVISTSKKQTFTNIDLNFVDEKLLRIVEQYDCTIINLTYFYTPPGHYRVIHSDNTNSDNIAKINFVFNGAGSVMKWWKLKDESALPTVGTVPADGHLYYYYSEDQCDLVASTDLVSPTMVNAGALHSLENFTDNHRWAMCFLLGDIETRQVLQWDEAASRLYPIFLTD